MRVFLVGYMGSGKTHIGKKLATRLGVDFIDLDEHIESSENASIAQIFSEHGEGYFRELESAVLGGVVRLNDVVVATGGGAPCFFDNMERMNASGTTVYLKTSGALLWSRLKNQIAKRPLLAGKPPAEIQRFITEQLKVRAPYYERAGLIIEQNQNDETTVDEIIDRLQAISQS